MSKHDDLFDDDADASEAEAEEAGRPAWGAPEGAEAPPRGPGLAEQARLRWDTWTRGQRAGVVAIAVTAALMGLTWLAGRGAEAEGAAPPPTSTASTFVSTSTTAAEPDGQLVQVAAQRLRDDPLRGLPDLHPMVVAYAGGAGPQFSNAVHALLAGGADMCNIWFGVDELGWRVVPETEANPLPSDWFPVRVFLGHPCLPAVGVPDPQVVPTTTTSTTAPGA